MWPNHFDLDTIRQLPRNTRFLCARFECDSVEATLRRLGFDNVITIGHKETVALNGWERSLRNQDFLELLIRSGRQNQNLSD